jgi:hypothetical protein
MMNSQILDQLVTDVSAFLQTRRTPGMPFGHFNQCVHAFAADELSALCGDLEIWKMLGLPLTDTDLDHAVSRFAQSQHPETGLIIDPTWEGRLNPEGSEMLIYGDSFFTRSAVCALRAWGRRFPRPVTYISEIAASDLPDRILWNRGGHHRYSIGDFAVLLLHNKESGVPGAEELYQKLVEATESKQDPATGLWLWGDPKASLTPSINLTFHTIKFTFNVLNRPLPHPERIVDSCLAASRDERYYSWETGYACNDLDLAHVLYSALHYTDHRREESAEWARERLPMILSIQKPDGGFSFFHERAMDKHYLLDVSPSKPEGDLWGTLMYMGTLYMMVRIGYPELPLPWRTSEVHKVPHAS